MLSLIQHQKSSKHCPCPRCDLSDTHEELVEAKLPAIDKYSCPECKKHFVQKPSLGAHQRETRHAHCYNCDITFPTKGLYAKHMQSHSPVSAKPPSSSSVTQFRCCDCKRDFKSENALEDHLRDAKIHKPRKKGKEKKNQSENKQYEDDMRPRCKKCKKTFESQHALGQHLSSVRHKPLSDIKCIAAETCEKRFNCPSAQLHHLESGKCVSRMTKGKLNAAIAASDKNNIITSRAKVADQWLLDDDNSSTPAASQILSPILTLTTSQFLDSYPPSPSGILTPTSTLSAPASMTFPALALRQGTGAQKCPLCPPRCTRVFNPGALKDHLSSKVHLASSETRWVPLPLSIPMPDTLSFHCPSALISQGRKNASNTKHFSTVSGLAQHLESGACDGGKSTFRQVVKYVQKEMKDMGFGTLRLLK